MSGHTPWSEIRRKRGLQVVTWKWGDLFGPEYVNKLQSMLKRHLHTEHTLHCITDNPDGLNPGICRHPMFEDHADMSAGNRSCFRRLRIFDREMANMFGPRILQLDLDVVFTDDVTPLFTRPDPLVLVEQTRANRRVTYNPSMLLMDAGILHSMWEKFHAAPKQTWYDAKSHGWACSDMSVINDYLDQHTTVPRATWTTEEGVGSYWRDIMNAPAGHLPKGLRAVLFYGHQNPSDAAVLERSPWIEDHWR